MKRIVGLPYNKSGRRAQAGGLNDPEEGSVYPDIVYKTPLRIANSETVMKIKDDG